MAFSDTDPRTLLSAPRLCDRPFPPYRFTPGRDPHPIADPRGHSFLPPGQSHPAVTYYPPDQWRQSIDYLYGCDLYNHGYWWEAHEAWEGLWRVVPNKNAQKHFLQGIIQAGACYLKLLLGHSDGVGRLRGSSADHLKSAMDLSSAQPMMGIDIAEFLRQFTNYLEHCYRAAGQPAAHHPSHFPYLVPG